MDAYTKILEAMKNPQEMHRNVGVALPKLGL